MILQCLLTLTPSMVPSRSMSRTNLREKQPMSAAVPTSIVQFDCETVVAHSRCREVA